MTIKNEDLKGFRAFSKFINYLETLLWHYKAKKGVEWWRMDGGTIRFE